jgi:hypothetical protein
MPLSRLQGSQLVYQALSYAWGPKTDFKSILIENVQASSEGVGAAVPDVLSLALGQGRLHVRPNLYSALRRLRSESEELWFWIDAICIDQSNLVEKIHQIPRMLDIYCNAWSVCVWLGEPERPTKPGMDEPFDLIGTIINLKLLEHIVEGPNIDEQMMMSLVAFAKLLKRPWFSRRWVIQEISSSTRASVQYGDRKVNWIDFADAVQLFILKIDRIRALYRASTLFEQDPDALSHVEAAGASAIVQATNNVLRKGEDGRIIARLDDIETLVMRFVHFQASDPRDTIFALWSLADYLNIARDRTHIFQPRFEKFALTYSQPCESIYTDFVYHCIKLHRSLDIICRHWALPIPSGRMPSWVGTTVNSPFGMHLDSGGRMNGDSLVGLPGSTVYHASRKLLPNLSDPPRMLDSNIALRVRGRTLSRVTQVSPRILDGIVSYDALRLLGWIDRASVDTIPDRLWRTLVADRTTDGSKAPSWWRRASMFAFSMASRDGDLNTQRLLQNKSLPQTVHEYLRRVQAIVWNRRIFAVEPIPANTTANNGTDAINVSSVAMTGLGPRDAQTGDHLSILLGCSVPVILRRVGSAESARVYKLVGECYVHGMMDGEALDFPESAVCSGMADFDLV